MPVRGSDRMLAVGGIIEKQTVTDVEERGIACGTRTEKDTVQDGRRQVSDISSKAGGLLIKIDGSDGVYPMAS